MIKVCTPFRMYSFEMVFKLFLKRQSDVYIVTLDASAAFGKVNFYGLLSKLTERGISIDIMRVLLSWYTDSKACVI